MEDSIPTTNEFWAIIELMGHQRIAGKVSPSPICPGTLIRVDVPTVDGVIGFTKMVSQSAIYAITITDEQTARAMVQFDKPSPMSEYTIRQAIKALPGGMTEGHIEPAAIASDDDDHYDGYR